MATSPPPSGDRPPDFDVGIACARRLDEADPLRTLRDLFHIPPGGDRKPMRYFCGNSLGLMPRAAREEVQRTLDQWERLAVDAHFEADPAWYSYHEIFREPGARLVGARPGEVVMMNSLTVNLHLMMVSFYRPTSRRFRILMERNAFPSDTYAASSQLRLHGYDPGKGLVLVGGEETSVIDEAEIEEVLEREGDSIALVLLPGVQFLTGQLFDLARICRAAHDKGCKIGLDLAHATGNVPLELHRWGVDFAVWCSYKYLNSGPGALGGCFVHEKHGGDKELPRLAGWWGNDPGQRFLMHLLPEFKPVPGAEGWQLSNPPILAAAPLRASIEIFDRVGMAALRAKSVLLTAYLEFLLRELCDDDIALVTPAEPERRGCQLSLLLKKEARARHDALRRSGVTCDFREPDIIRVAPVPLYNSFRDVHHLATALAGGKS